ncbi:alpha/beta fold hydrolase [Flavitalea antarctica]
MAATNFVIACLITLNYKAMHGQTIQTAYITANGYQFTYLEAGKGPLVLLFHGFPDNPHSFTSQLKALAVAGYRAVAPYKRGFAPGDMALNPIQHSTLYMQDAAALVEAFSEEKVFLIGHDWGAGAVYGVAKLAPARVKAIVTMSIPLSPAFFSSYTTNPQQMKRSWYLFYFQSPYAVEGLKHNDYAMIDFLFQTWCPDWKDYNSHLETVKEMFRKTRSAEAAVEYYRQSFGSYELKEPELQKIQAAFYDGKAFIVPTLYLHGQSDGCIGSENVEGMEGIFSSGFEKYIIPGAGHFLQLEKPEAVNRYIINFLKQLE